MNLKIKGKLASNGQLCIIPYSFLKIPSYHCSTNFKCMTYGPAGYSLQDCQKGKN